MNNNSRTKEALRTKGIEQAWRRRFFYNIHSGVRVKIQRKYSSLIQSNSFEQTNRVQSMLKRLWFESETSALNKIGQKSLEKINPKSYLTTSIFDNNFSRKNHLEDINQKNKIVHSIGIQTIIIKQIDRQISCHLVSSIIDKSQSTFSSSTFSSKTSISNDTESITTISNTNTVTNESNSYNEQYQRNNNAIDTDIEQINMKDFKTRKSITQLMNNEQTLHDTNPQSLSGRKKNFFDSIFNLISFLRLSSFKRNRVSISTTPIITDIDRNENNKNIRPPTSRCRRSTARNFNHYSSIRSDENVLSKCNHLEQNNSIHSMSDKSILTEKQYRQGSISKVNHSNLSIVDSHRLRKKFKTSTQRKYKHRKTHTKRHHRKKRNHIRRSSHSQCSSELKILSIPSIANESQPLSSIDDQSTVSHVKYSNHDEIPQTTLVLPSIESKPSQDLLYKPLDKQLLPSIDSIRLRVKNKNLIPNLSKSQIPLSSIYSVDQSIEYHQKNIINEFKSILQQTKNLHLNNQ